MVIDSSISIDPDFPTQSSRKSMTEASTNGALEDPSLATLTRGGKTEGPLRLLVIGAGSRGNSYAKAVGTLDNAIIASIAEPIQFKRHSFGKKYIWPGGHPQEGQYFETWQDFVRYEKDRRQKCELGEQSLPGVDGAFICTPDTTHVEIVESLATFGLHVMCEKPLATSLKDCQRIYQSLKRAEEAGTKAVFSVGHVLRYSPHNMLLKRLIENGAIGDILSIEHTEPVGFWHFAHSYVRCGRDSLRDVCANVCTRGNWRSESATAPSLLTKSGHDIDLILWIMGIAFGGSPRLPSWLTSNGSLAYFRRSRKPREAEEATNCLSCNFEEQCIYSAKRIYVDHHLLEKEKLGWPVDIVEPEIEECWNTLGKAAAKDRLMARLAEDYDETTPPQIVQKRPWFGRCVYESDNDVCDDQMVLLEWDETNLETPTAQRNIERGHAAKIASFHMVAFTEKQCERRGRIYGTGGEIEYDGMTIRVHDFATQKTQEHHPLQEGGGHGGGDYGLTRQFVRAIHAVKETGETVEIAQRKYVGATLDDMIQSHVLAFAAEDARKGRKSIQCSAWWKENFTNET